MKWNPELNEKLKEAVSINGTNDWGRVADHVGVDRRACWNHFMNALKPINISEWTPAEDEFICDFVKKYGPKWSFIEKAIVTSRTAKQIQNRYKILARTNDKKTQTDITQLGILLCNTDIADTKIAANPNPNLDPADSDRHDSGEEFDWRFETLL
jgi:hypothetical protein